MAEGAIKKLNQQLNCSICLGIYTDPKSLQCGHIFCMDCLIKLVKSQRGRPACPTCRQDIPLPPSGARGLQSAFRINNLLEIRDDLEKAKDPLPSLESGDAADAIICSEHGKELELYCETCNELICWKCAFKGGKHHDHNSDQITGAFEKCKKDIMSSLEPMEKQLTTIHTALAESDKRSVEIYDQQATIEATIHDNIRRLYEMLDVRKTELIGQLNQVTQRKLKSLASRRDQMETIQAQLNSCLDFIKESLKTSSHEEVLKMKTTIVKQITTPFQLLPDQPNTEADITFSASPEIIVECKQYGTVLSSGSPDPSNCHATGKGLEVAAVGEKSSVILQAIDYNGSPFIKPINWKCELVSEITHTTVRGSAERKGQSQYKINYQPTIKGRHQLHIKVDDQHIRGSPYSLAVKLPVEKLGIPFLSIDGVKRPWGVAFNQRGEVVVSGWGKDCISIFSLSGEKTRFFGTSGSGPGQLEYPRGVAVDNVGNILVSDNENHRIQQFTAEGQFITSAGTRSYGPHPHGIAFNHSNNKVYVVVFNDCVAILNADLSFSKSFGKHGSGKGQFNYPYDVACDRNGKVYVADRHNHRIQVFTAEGKFLRMFGKRGDRRGELNCPVSIAIDNSNRVYVGDLKHQISVFTSDGQFLTTFGKKGVGLGEFNSPYGLAVDASGMVYVCDHDNNRIQLF